METPFLVVGKLKCDHEKVCYSVFIIEIFIFKFDIQGSMHHDTIYENDQQDAIV
jgi:hypothetical protein